jgi:hypothetical protein
MLSGVWRGFGFICSVKQTLCFALYRETDCADHVVLVSALNLVYSVMCPLRNSACTLAIVNSTQSNQANDGTVSRLGHNRFLTDSLALISHLLIRRCIVSILRTSLNNQQKICEAFLRRLFKMFCPTLFFSAINKDRKVQFWRLEIWCFSRAHTEFQRHFSRLRSCSEFLKYRLLQIPVSAMSCNWILGSRKGKCGEHP